MPSQTGLYKFGPWESVSLQKAPGICLLKANITSLCQPRTYPVHAPSQLPATHSGLAWLALTTPWGEVQSLHLPLGRGYQRPASLSCHPG